MGTLAEDRVTMLPGAELRNKAVRQLGDGRSPLDRMKKPELREYVRKLQLYPIALELQTTELERIQALANDLAEETDRFYEAVPIGFFVLDKAGHIAKATVAGAAMLGLERPAVVGRLLASFVLPEDRSVIEGFLKWLHHSGAKQTCRFRLLSERKTISVLAEGTLDSAGAGREETYSVVMVDVTQYAEAELAIRDRETLYRSLFDNIDVGVLLMDANYTVVAVNPAARKIFGQTAQELIGRKCCQGFAGQEELCSYCPGTRSMATLQTAEVEVPRTRPDGTTFVVRLKAIPMTGPNGDIVGFMELVEELTEQKRTEEQLRESASVIAAKNQALIERTAALEEATRARDDFLTSMSHELRTPLNAVIGLSDGLLNRVAVHPLNEHQVDRVRRIKSGGEYLLTLINAALDVPKRGASTTEVNIAGFDIGVLFRDLGRAAEGLLHGKPKVRFLLDVEEGIPSIVSDRDKIRQILSTLLGNAARFTDEGLISLVVRRQGQTLMIRVEDTGRGISQKHVNRVFDESFRASDATAASPQGSGLGLAMCKSLSTTLGGDIFVQSDEGKGSRFTVVLPMVLDENAVIAAGNSIGRD